MAFEITDIRLAILVIGTMAVLAMAIGAVTGKISEIGVGIAVSSGISAIAGLAGYDMVKKQT